MPERPGDMSIEERVNAGYSDLDDLSPDGGSTNRDMVTVFNQSKYRQNVYHGKITSSDTASRDRTNQYVEGPRFPRELIDKLIEIEDRKWDYRTDPDSENDRKRVFTLRDQFIDLDVDKSLFYMSAHKGTERYTELREQLEEEASHYNTNNQVIMQLMHNRIERGESLLPRGSNKPLVSSV